MNHATALTLILIIPAAAGCADSTPPAVHSPRLFTEVASASGVNFVHHSGAAGNFLLPEIMGGGAGFVDVDGDGYLDIYLVDSAGPNRLYRNTGDASFTEITLAAGVGDTGYGMGCAAGDYDNDGDLDLYVTNLGANVLYRNNGDGTFSDVTALAGVGDPSWSTSAAFLDYDADGDLDLFVTNYVDWSDTPAFTFKQCFAAGGARDYCSPQAYGAPSTDTLYRNDGDGSFTDVSAEAGILARAGTGLGVVCTDLDGDGVVDIYVANDQMPSFAWINSGDGRFTESAVRLSCAVDEMGKSQAGMGVDAADIDGDGDTDLWKVHLHGESHVLYINEGTYFDDATGGWGLAAPTRRATGFGTALFDYDLDGLLDVFIANGRVQIVADATPGDDPYAEPNQLLRQVEPGRFEEVTSAAGDALKLIGTSRAAAFGDYDNDGDVDILVVNRDGPARLLRNDAPRRGDACTLRILDRHGRDAFGAIVRCTFGRSTRTLVVRSAYSYCAANDPRLHIGLGEAARLDRVEVRWPDGTGQPSETFGPFEAGSFVVIQQGNTLLSAGHGTVPRQGSTHEAGLADPARPTQAAAVPGASSARCEVRGERAEVLPGFRGHVAELQAELVPAKPDAPGPDDLGLHRHPPLRGPQLHLNEPAGPARTPDPHSAARQVHHPPQVAPEPSSIESTEAAPVRQRPQLRSAGANGVRHPANGIPACSNTLPHDASPDGVVPVISRRTRPDRP